MPLRRYNGAIASQQAYYKRTASWYDPIQVGQHDEHAMALAWMAALISHRQFTSVLDIGSGTGRALHYLQDRKHLRLLGVEPSAALREIGYGKGLSRSMLIEGDALQLEFADDSFDLVCAFGVLHHIADHRRAVAEMTRVAKRAVFISDANNFGQGSAFSRLVKQFLGSLRLWEIADYIRTGFKGYHYSEGDGIYYSYSIFSDINIIRMKFKTQHYMNTRRGGPNLYRSADTIALFSE